MLSIFVKKINLTKFIDIYLSEDIRWDTKLIKFMQLTSKTY